MMNEREEMTLKILEFIESLNLECTAGALVTVEGKKDESALREAGFRGDVLVYNNFKGITNFVDHVSGSGRKVILLLDRDKKGRSLTSKIFKKLNHFGCHDGLYYKKWFVRITHGKIMCIENLSNYCSTVSEKYSKFPYQKKSLI